METTLAARVARGDRGALARALTVLEREGSRADELAQTLRSRGRGAFVVGVSGPPGAGKSTLISALVTEWRQRGERVAVLAVDPSSPLSRGALLGDRIRMDHHTSDPDVFIRSVASRGRLGGLSRALEAQLAAVDAAGWQIVILETLARYARTQFVDPAPGAADAAKVQAQQRSAAGATSAPKRITRRTVKKAFYSDEEDESQEEEVRGRRGIAASTPAEEASSRNATHPRRASRGTTNTKPTKHNTKQL